MSLFKGDKTICENNFSVVPVFNVGLRVIQAEYCGCSKIDAILMLIQLTHLLKCYECMRLCKW